jgi:hypothetical protein
MKNRALDVDDNTRREARARGTGSSETYRRNCQGSGTTTCPHVSNADHDQREHE